MKYFKGIKSCIYILSLRTEPCFSLASLTCQWHQVLGRYRYLYILIPACHKYLPVIWRYSFSLASLTCQWHQVLGPYKYLYILIPASHKYLPVIRRYSFLLASLTCQWHQVLGRYLTSTWKSIYENFVISQTNWNIPLTEYPKTLFSFPMMMRVKLHSDTKTRGRWNFWRYFGQLSTSMCLWS